jgi:hypothetical protein
MTVDLVNGRAAPSEPTNATATDRITRFPIGKGMRIAQVAPLAESVPPKLYGGTERVVSWLIEELVELGRSTTVPRQTSSPCGRPCNSTCAQGELSNASNTSCAKDDAKALGVHCWSGATRQRIPPGTEMTLGR